MRMRVFLAGCLAAAYVAPLAYGQATRPANDTVTLPRADYDKLLQRLDSVEGQLKEVRQQQKTGPSAAEVDQTIEEIEKDVKTNRGLISELSPGTSQFLVTGYAFAGFTNRRGENSSFNAGWAPIFLWKVSDRIFVETEPEFELTNEEGEGGTKISLEYADINYFLNDYMTVRGGLFLTPFGQFPERLHPAWINKLPDFPLVYQEEGGLVPFSSLGFELRGAVPVKTAQFNYAVYVANGPKLVTDNPDAFGSLEGENFDDNNNGKAVGGRIGFRPIPELELGYSVQFAQAAGGDFRDVRALLQAVDLSYTHEVDAISGAIDFRGEWVWSNVDQATYDPTGALGFGPVTFDNDRNGGYLQLAYRPSKVSNKTIRSLEFVTRYDLLNGPSGGPQAFDEQRWTFGVNYWLGPGAVFKLAYQIDDKTEGENQNALLLQGAVGF
jgi:hypothetical protein